jgi:hypothetical protein
MSEEDTSLMDELTAAWDEHESEEAEELDTGPVEESIAEPPTEAPTEAPVSGAIESASVAVDKQATEKDAPVADDVAPKGLSVGMRENWKNLDSQTKDEFRRYEQRIGGMAQKYAQDARRAHQMDKVMKPYAQLMQMNGGPQNILPGLLQTGAALQTGNEIERARTVAGLISQFGVNPAQVADFLDNKTPEQSGKSKIDELFNERLAPIQQQLAQFQQREQQFQQQGQQKVAEDIASFSANHEFFDELREPIADILDIAARNGRQMSLEEAWEQARWQNPEIRKVMLARQSQGQVQQRKRASSSIHGTPGGEGSSAALGDLRSTLEQAFQTANRM